MLILYSTTGLLIESGLAGLLLSFFTFEPTTTISRGLRLVAGCF